MKTLFRIFFFLIPLGSATVFAAGPQSGSVNFKVNSAQPTGEAPEKFHKQFPDLDRRNAARHSNPGNVAFNPQSKNTFAISGAEGRRYILPFNVIGGRRWVINSSPTCMTSPVS